MFYVPYKFKSQDEPTTPRGPNFSRAPLISTNIGGIKFSVKLPRHKTSLKSGYLTPKSRINFNECDFVSLDDKKSKFKVYNILSRTWDFHGHNFMGAVGDLTVDGWLMKISDQPNGTSFFHPIFLENTISDYLLNLYCKHKDRYEENEPYQWIYQAPVEWKTLQFFDELQGVKFRVLRDTDFATGYVKTYIFVPISDTYILWLEFCIRKNVNTDREVLIDEWINPQPFIDLREQIIGSIKVELSEDAKKQREIALQGVANPKLSETFAPIDWPKDGVLKEKFDIENDDGWGEYS